MSKIEIIKLPDPRFNEYSLDDFIRHQEVSECWRNIDGEWKLLPIAFTEDWGLEKRREEAADRLRIELFSELYRKIYFAKQEHGGLRM